MISDSVIKSRSISSFFSIIRILQSSGAQVQYSCETTPYPFPHNIVTAVPFDMLSQILHSHGLIHHEKQHWVKLKKREIAQAWKSMKSKLDALCNSLVFFCLSILAAIVLHLQATSTAQWIIFQFLNFLYAFLSYFSAFEEHCYNFSEVLTHTTEGKPLIKPQVYIATHALAPVLRFCSLPFEE